MTDHDAGRQGLPLTPTLDRAGLFADRSLRGLELSRAYGERVDAWLRQLYRLASSDADGVALVAVGGYGRAELAPQSDLDVLLLHTGVKGIGAIAERIWYPVWDEGLKLGHSVRTPKEALSLAAEDLDTATSLVTIRHLAGDPALTEDLAATGPGPVAQAGPPLAQRDQRPGRRAPQAWRARWRSCSSPTSRRAGAGCATCTPSAGPSWRRRSCSKATTPAWPSTTTCSSPCGSSCTGGRPGPGTGSCSRSRTRWPPPSTTPTPTRSWPW